MILFRKTRPLTRVFLKRDNSSGPQQPNQRRATMNDPTAMKIEAMVKAAVEAVLGNQVKTTKAAANGNGKAPKLTKDETDLAVCRAFKKAGYGDVTPRGDVQTYNRWLAQGYKVKSGEKSIKVKQFRL